LAAMVRIHDTAFFTVIPLRSAVQRGGAKRRFHVVYEILGQLYTKSKNLNQ
jgi:hypothetical protein